MQTALFRIRANGKRVPFCRPPNPDALEQDAMDNPRVRILRCRYFLHRVSLPMTKSSHIIINSIT